jgi:hypothetical protein
MQRKSQQVATNLLTTSNSQRKSLPDIPEPQTQPIVVSQLHHISSTKNKKAAQILLKTLGPNTAAIKLSATCCQLPPTY